MFCFLFEGDDSMKTIILIAIVAVIAFFALRSVYRMLTAKEGGCSCSCGSCKASGKCPTHKS